ncbi:MAG: hypothetical protein BJBARM4_0803 [Candidatus Parvarchaeum acidiphilum ARMAN-4]|jgi:preprotein translocase subunit Sss1|uniref:Uncharacterized protein n=1 Tax=Candidatus Parvarchaeum acidiphilum ARMAN-4 TaxID=662760 RepID=D2EGA3_PARA4|nr:hypothetical protein [Candidatus Parvarchaeum acidiphilum ARMAN-4]EEZ92606.1 MAG: hypothetical protein BJBARM4_0803 [Candidatus Parvarchaeum acidiphilum ARMAN-4]
MDFVRDKIEEIKATLVILVLMIVASAVGASVTGFKILLYGIAIASFIGTVGYIIHLLYSIQNQQDLGRV